MRSIEDFCQDLKSYLTANQIAQISRAYDFSELAHRGQTRQSGEPYITHPLAAAIILGEMHMDHQCIMGALLHDTIEDTAATKEQITEQFDAVVAEIVDGVTKLGKLQKSSSTAAERQAENFLKMTMAMSKDIRVIIVKLADRLHNMRTLGVLTTEKRERIARETLDIYAPIAQRLGINDIRVELEDRGFEALYPMRARRLRAALITARGRRKDLVVQIQESIVRRLEKESFPADVTGREKHIFSIYKKMRSRKVSFKDIMDVFAFRIRVSNVDQCYRALGIVHSLFKPVPGEFKDYIAIPKSNGYQSLHTQLIGMHGVPIEVQIRTNAMDDMANFGIAAHWFYKEQDGKDSSGVSSRASDWVKRLIELQKEAGDPLEFIEHVKTDLFPDEIYVFTPKGKIIELPNGATCVDFAFALHTDIGNSTVGCKINGQLAPLSSKLQSGSMVEVIRANKMLPHPGWLDFIVTAKARSAIRHNLKFRHHKEAMRLGRQLLNQSLADIGLTLESIDSEKIQQLVCDGQHESFDEILIQIATGERRAFAVAKLLVSKQQASKLGELSSSSIVVDSGEGHMINFGGCCHPIPGDNIMGHLSAGRGLVVHREDCPNIKTVRQNPELCIPIRWSHNLSNEFQVELWVDIEMHRGVVADLAATITKRDAGIEHISTEERSADLSVFKLMLRVKNRVHLASIMRRIRLQPYVKKCRRGFNV